MVRPKNESNCTSCGVALLEGGSVKFPCPMCGEEIGRCPRCRVLSTKYVCKECGFEGP
ncbi:MAG: zinc finger domain-containing protein [Methermicoccaceae archaeon]